MSQNAQRTVVTSTAHKTANFQNLNKGTIKPRTSKHNLPSRNVLHSVNVVRRIT